MRVDDSNRFICDKPNRRASFWAGGGVYALKFNTSEARQPSPLTRARELPRLCRPSQPAATTECACLSSAAIGSSGSPARRQRGVRLRSASPHRPRAPRTLRPAHLSRRRDPARCAALSSLCPPHHAPPRARRASTPSRASSRWCSSRTPTASSAPRRTSRRSSATPPPPPGRAPGPQHSPFRPGYPPSTLGRDRP